MGAFGSKEDPDIDDDAKFVYDPSKIFWDENGNLRYGKSHPVKQEKQIRDIMQLDHVDDEEATVWYIVDSAWIASWLAFVHFDTAIAPAPGPCRNDRLLAWSDDESKYIGRFGLFMAVKNRAGDYRRVSKPTWDKFCSLYPGSGPSITMELSKESMNETGIYDTSKWTIVDPPSPPENTHKKKKMRFGFRNKKDKDVGKDDDLVAAVNTVDKAQRPSFESKEGEIDFADIYGERISENKDGVNIGGGQDSVRLSSHNEVDGLLLIESNSVRSSSIAHGASRDSYIENVFFGKD